jgi:hypothetical protein
VSWQLALIVPMLVLPIVLLLGFAGCALLAPLDDHTFATTTDPKLQNIGFVGDPTCTIVGTQVTCVGKLEGLGSSDLLIQLDVTGTAMFSCIQRRPPPPVPVPISSQGNPPQEHHPGEFNGGQLSFTIVSPLLPTTADATQIGCDKTATGTSLGEVRIALMFLTVTQNGKSLYRRPQNNGPYTAGGPPIPMV